MVSLSPEVAAATPILAADAGAADAGIAGGTAAHKLYLQCTAKETKQKCEEEDDKYKIRTEVFDVQLLTQQDCDGHETDHLARRQEN